MIRSRAQLEQVLSEGRSLQCELVHNPESRTLWSVLDTGEHVFEQAANWALKAGKLVPQYDGPFADFSQTYAAPK